MVDAPGPLFHPDEGVLDRLDDLDGRLTALERTRWMENASIKDGVLKIFDADDKLRIEIGLLPSAVTGLRIYGGDEGGPDDDSVLEVSNEAGFWVPRQNIPMGSTTQGFGDTANTSHEEKWSQDFHVTSKLISGEVGVSVPGGETVTVKATIEVVAGGGGETTLDEQSANASGILNFDNMAVPGGADAFGVLHRLRYYARTTGGTGKAWPLRGPSNHG